MKTIYSPAYRRLTGQLKAARLKAGLTQEQAGRTIGKGRNWVSLIESSQQRLDILHFALLCIAYGTSAVEMIRDLEHDVQTELRDGGKTA